MTRTVAILVLCAALVVAGCQRHVAGNATPSSFIDTLPLSLTEVRQISGIEP